MNAVTIRQISQADIEGLPSCINRFARERKYLGFTKTASDEIYM